MNKYLTLLVIIFIFSGCNIEMPEKWEVPNWQVPFTIPLIDKTYFISQLSNNNKVCSDTSYVDSSACVDSGALWESQNQIQIGVPFCSIESYVDSTSCIDNDGQWGATFFISINETLLEPGDIVVEESYFQVPALESFSDNFTFLIPSSTIPNIEPQLFSISMEELTENIDLINEDCLPYQSTDLMNIEFGSSAISIYENITFDYITNIHDVNVGEGSIEITITNEFPFDITQVTFTFLNEEDGSIWKTTTINNILSGQTKNGIINIVNESIPSSISLNTETVINNEIPSQNDNECNFYVIAEDINNEFACQFAGYSWIDNQCVIDTGENGWIINGNEFFNMSISFLLDNLESVIADIEYNIENTIVEDFEVDEGISLIEAKFAETQNQDTNKVNYNLQNNFFSDVNMSITIDEIYNLNGTKYEKDITITQGNSYLEIDNLSNMSIKKENGSNVDIVNINYEIEYSENNVIILFDHDYSFDINTIEISALQFDELNIELDEFSTPPINMATMPAGLESIQLPTLSFHLQLYNEIKAPLTLILDIMGITGDETTVIHAEPKLRYPDGYSGIDTTFIDIVSDSLIVIGSDYEEYYDLGSPISSLFGKDDIQVSGYAVLDGDATLEPGKSFWGDIEIEIRPLTIVLDAESVLIPQEYTALQLEESTNDMIGNTLVEGEIFLEITNNMPIGAHINLLASNYTFFPLCYDSLSTGKINTQIVSSTCLNLINSYYSPDSIFVERLEDNSIYYTKFINEIDTILIGKLMKLSLDAPTNLDENGFIIDGAVSYDTATLDSLELSWINKYETLYLSPMINNLSTSIDTLPGWITFHTTDNLRIRSFITLTIDTDGLLNSSDE